ncbi:MAG TPA: hypothetical protein VH300_19320 [Thermoleophilaceae bacterium]|nr:hypothetical protein [Thermoleophilaceae bacterium]
MQRMRLAILPVIFVTVALAAAAPASADDYPVCSGDLSAAGVPQQPGPAQRVGITPRVEAGQLGTPAAAAKPEDPAKTLGALARLRPAGGPFVVRLNRFFWSDGEAAFKRFLAEARRYSDAGYEVELQVRYRPSSAQEGDIAAWTKHVREVVDRFGAIPGVVGLQITNEVNFDFSSDSSDGAYSGGKDALIQGVIAAKDEARKKGLKQLEIGFNWAYRYDPVHEQAFWDYLRDKGGQPFVAALDWVGLDAYPGTVFPPAEQSVDDYRDGMVNAMSSFRCYLRAAGIPDTVPMHIEENGWPTFGTRREDMQAQVADRMIRAASDFRGTYNVSDYRWFNLRDANTGDPAIAQHFGLMRDDYSEKPAFAVVANLFGALGRQYPAGARTGSGCLRRAGTLHSTGIGGARIGSRRGDVIRRLGVPTAQTAGSMGYCVDGGGKLAMAFDRRGRLRLAASTSFSTHVHRIRTGSSLIRVKRAYPRAFWIGKRLLRARRGSRVLFGSCSCGSVAFVAVSDARTAAKLRYYARRAGLTRVAAEA